MGNKKLIHYEQEVKDLKVKVWLKLHIQKSDYTMRKLSLMLGKNENYLRALGNAGDFRVSQLMALGNYLDTNPFEPYRSLLNHSARPTRTEATQAARIAELEAQIILLEKERDIYKEVAMRG